MASRQWKRNDPKSQLAIPNCFLPDWANSLNNSRYEPSNHFQDVTVPGKYTDHRQVFGFR